MQFKVGRTYALAFPSKNELTPVKILVVSTLTAQVQFPWKEIKWVSLCCLSEKIVPVSDLPLPGLEVTS